MFRQDSLMCFLLLHLLFVFYFNLFYLFFFLAFTAIRNCHVKFRIVHDFDANNSNRVNWNPVAFKTICPSDCLPREANAFDWRRYHIALQWRMQKKKKKRTSTVVESASDSKSKGKCSRVCECGTLEDGRKFAKPWSLDKRVRSVKKRRSYDVSSTLS